MIANHFFNEFFSVIYILLLKFMRQSKHLKKLELYTILSYRQKTKFEIKK